MRTLLFSLATLLLTTSLSVAGDLKTKPPVRSNLGDTGTHEVGHIKPGSRTSNFSWGLSQTGGTSLKNSIGKVSNFSWGESNPGNKIGGRSIKR